ncbi:F-type H+-transporting ATPase subunit alpha [Thermoflexales bacterium]|nr:F-type H+-transporting ATPase subunit alpha [Thermoflexales bacterium]
MAAEIESLIKDLTSQINAFKPQVEAVDVGEVLEVGDGIARVSGLTHVQLNELVEFSNGVLGVAFNLEEDRVGVIILGEYAEIEEGQLVRRTQRIASVPVGDALLGRVVDPLGRPLDGKGPIVTSKFRNIERIAPGVIERSNVNRPVQTGIKPIDAMIPIGRGQRELIIGDRQTGKSAICVDTIINQKGQDLVCVYVAIGQKRSAIARLVATLEKFGALEYSIIVIASASDPASLQYIAPYAGCAIGEEVMETGVTIGGQLVKDALVVYDDLSKHAWAYRQVSLLMRRPPAREAYPGDVFYLHSRLLERAAQLSQERGGGSLTALPIIETLLGDVSAYIPTNVISITDGQIYLETDLFNAGIRPAMNVGISVSRVGGDAQTKAMKQVAGRLKGDMAQYRDLAAFAAFGSDLDATTRRQLERGQRLTEILKQPQYAPVSLANQVVTIFAATNGYADNVPVARMKDWEAALNKFISTQYAGVLQAIQTEKRISDETLSTLKQACEEFKKSWS